MRIAQLAPLIESVPPHGYGGTELVVSHLTDELVKMGHEVTLFATADSRTGARLVSTAETGVRAAGIPVHRWSCYELENILSLMRIQSQFDVIHNHLGFYALPFLQNADCAVVSTNHNPIMSYCKNIYFEYSHQPYVSISDAYQRHNFGDRLNYVARVYNGIEVDAFHPVENPRCDYVLFIGRICDAKGTREAIEISKAVNKPLLIAGKIDPADQAYFEASVKDLIDGENVKYIGEVNFAQKLELYQNALAVIYPIKFEEPFGLVMAEALATGTPTFALDRGSVREVLSDKETAVIGSSVEELIGRFPEISKLDRRACIDRARSLFDKTRMAEEYVKVYQKLLDTASQKDKVSCLEKVSSTQNYIAAAVSGKTAAHSGPVLKTFQKTGDASGSSYLT